jgi:hypothetical protein
MDKKVIQEDFHIEAKHVKDGAYTWGEIKSLITKAGLDLQDEDSLLIQSEPGYYEEDFWYEPSYNIILSKYRIETDEEFKDRVDSEERAKVRAKEQRRRNYERLKAEFEL